MSVAYVRQQIADNPTDSNGNPVLADQIFSDAEIDVFISQEGGNLLLAASSALYAIAANEALVLKKMTVEGETTDGAAVATALHKLAFQMEMRATGPDVQVW